MIKSLHGRKDILRSSGRFFDLHQETWRKIMSVGIVILDIDVVSVKDPITSLFVIQVTNHLHL